MEEKHMKKIIAGIAALLIAAAALPVSAKGTDVLNGTPTLDGKLDEIYTQSASIELENFGFYIGGSTDTNYEAAKGTKAYFLWDKEYLYVCCVVVDDTATKTKQDGVDYENWATCDNLELYFWDADGNEDNRGNVHVGCLGDGLRWEKAFEGINIKAAGTATDTGYITEVAIPVSNFDLKAGSAFKFALQYNNFVPADEAAIASGYQKVDGATDFALVADKVTVKEEPKADDGASASTLDAGIVTAAAALAASGAAFISLKKRK